MNLPEGFEFGSTYPDGKTAVPVKDYIVNKQLKLAFDITEKMPAVPIKAHGEVWHTGWDIPTRWAVDAEDVCWKDGAHGGCLMPVEKIQLQELFMENEDYWPNLTYLNIDPPSSDSQKIAQTLELLSSYESQMPATVYQALIQSLTN